MKPISNLKIKYCAVNPINLQTTVVASYDFLNFPYTDGKLSWLIKIRNILTSNKKGR